MTSSCVKLVSSGWLIGVRQRFLEDYSFNNGNQSIQTELIFSSAKVTDHIEVTGFVKICNINSFYINSFN